MSSLADYREKKDDNLEFKPAESLLVDEDLLDGLGMKGVSFTNDNVQVGIETICTSLFVDENKKIICANYLSKKTGRKPPYISDVIILLPNIIFAILT